MRFLSSVSPLFLATGIHQLTKNSYLHEACVLWKCLYLTVNMEMQLKCYILLYKSKSIIKLYLLAFKFSVNLCICIVPSLRQILELSKYN